jgi:hypothetical protein
MIGSVGPLIGPRRLDFGDIERALNAYVGLWIRLSTTGVEAYGRLTQGYVAAPGLTVWDLEHAGRVIASLQLREREVRFGAMHDGDLCIQSRFDQVTVSKLDDVDGYDDQPPPGTLSIRVRDGVASLRRTD